MKKSAPEKKQIKLDPLAFGPFNAEFIELFASRRESYADGWAAAFAESAEVKVSVPSLWGHFDIKITSEENELN